MEFDNSSLLLSQETLYDIIVVNLVTLNLVGQPYRKNRTQKQKKTAGKADLEMFDSFVSDGMA